MQVSNTHTYTSLNVFGFLFRNSTIVLWTTNLQQHLSFALNNKLEFLVCLLFSYIEFYFTYFGLFFKIGFDVSPLGLGLFWLYKYFFVRITIKIGLLLILSQILCACVMIAHTYWFFIELSSNYQRSTFFVTFFLILPVCNSL